MNTVRNQPQPLNEIPVPDTNRRISVDAMGIKAVAVSNWVLAFIAICAFLFFTRQIMIPFVIAFMIKSFISPAVNILKDRYYIPRVLTLMAFLVLFALGLFAFSFPLSEVIERAIKDMSLYEIRMLEFINYLAAQAQNMGLPLNPEELTSRFKNLPFLRFLGSVATQVGNLIAGSVLVFVFLIFLVIGQKPSHRHVGVLSDIDRQIRQYLNLKILLSAVIAAIVGTILYFLNVELALFFACLTFILNFIPNFGPMIAVLLPIPSVFLQNPSIFNIAMLLTLPGIVHFVFGNIVETKLQGDVFSLHPVTVLFALMFWGLLWGVPGMFLATPLTCIMKVILEKFSTTNWLAQLMEGRLPFKALVKV